MYTDIAIALRFVTVDFSNSECKTGWILEGKLLHIYLSLLLYVHMYPGIQAFLHTVFLHGGIFE